MIGAWRGLGAGVLMLALGACAQLPGSGGRTLPPPASAGAKPAAPVVRATALKRYVEIIGPKIRYSPPFLGVKQTNYYLLRSWLARDTGRVATQIYVTDSYPGAERGFTAAYDASGQPLPFVSILRDQITCGNGCSWAEEFAATLPESVLEAGGQDYAVTFATRSGQRQTIHIAPAVLARQRAAVAAERARLRHASASAQ